MTKVVLMIVTFLRDAWAARTIARTGNPSNAKNAIAGIGIAALSCLFPAVPSAIAQAGEQHAPGASTIEPVAAPGVKDNAGQAEFGQARRPEVGMSLQEALALVGDDPDSQEEVGAACGMLDVLTWDKDGTRIISVDGTVTSIVEGKNKQP